MFVAVPRTNSARAGPHGDWEQGPACVDAVEEPVAASWRSADRHFRCSRLVTFRCSRICAVANPPIRRFKKSLLLKIGGVSLMTILPSASHQTSQCDDFPTQVDCAVARATPLTATVLLPSPEAKSPMPGDLTLPALARTGKPKIRSRRGGLEADAKAVNLHVETVAPARYN